MSKILKSEVMQGFIRLCQDGWDLGYHERNGGNLSYRMKDEEVKALKGEFSTERDWVSLGVSAKNAAGEYFIATGSGKFFRNVPLAPRDNVCICEISPKGDKYRMVWGLESGGKPTSEFPTHIMNHSVRKKATGGDARVIYHAHTPAVIALTFILPLKARDFSRALWQTATECPVIFPRGVGVVDWMVPGGADIALATCAEMKEYDAVVWGHHGLFASGPDFDITFGLMHTIEKAADIYIRILSCGKKRRQTITDDNLRAVAREFKVEINEAFLD